MPAEWNLDRQRLRARARRRMGLWAIASACMVATALYCIAFAHHKVRVRLNNVSSVVFGCGEQWSDVVLSPFATIEGRCFVSWVILLVDLWWGEKSLSSFDSPKVHHLIFRLLDPLFQSCHPPPTYPRYRPASSICQVGRGLVQDDIRTTQRSTPSYHGWTLCSSPQG